MTKLKATHDDAVAVKQIYEEGDTCYKLASDWLAQDTEIARLEGMAAKYEGLMDALERANESLVAQRAALTAVVDRLPVTADILSVSATQHASIDSVSLQGIKCERNISIPTAEYEAMVKCVTACRLAMDGDDDAFVEMGAALASLDAAKENGG